MNRFIAFMGSMLIVSGTVLGAITPSVAASTAGSTGYEAPTASVAPNEWTAPDNAFADDGIFASASGVDNDDQGYDGFGFSIPAGSIIEGFQVQVEASSTDATGCQITVALSDDNGASFGSNAPTQNLTDVQAVLTFGSDSNTFGEVWDPTQLEGSAFRLRVRMNDGGGCDDAAVVSIDSVAVNVHYRTINDSTVAHPTLPGDLCEAADFNFIIDMSGSIGAQGSFPSNLPDLKAGVIGFVKAFEGQGSGLYSGSRFNGTTASDLTNGFVSAGDTSTPGTFIDAVDALSGPTGTTPTAAGIDNGLDNEANDRAGVPNIMFVVTDGSPNVPPGGDLSNPAVWVQAADAAIAAADDARADGYRVYAVYVRTDNDPGDTTLPFSNPAGDAEWASTVMDRIGRGLVIDADFETLADDLIDEFGCRPEVTIEKTADQGPFSAGDEIGFTVTLTNEGDPAEGLVVTDHLPAGVVWAEDPDNPNWAIVAHDGHQDLTWIGGNLGKVSSSVHVSGITDAADCGVVENTASFTTTNDGQGSATAQLTVRCPDLVIAKTPNNGFISAGDDAVFEITVTNHGPGVAKNVDIDDTLPAGLSWTEVVDRSECSITGGVLHCDVGNLGDDESFSVSVKATTSVQSCTALPNTATADADNHGQVSDPGLITCRLPDLVIAKTPNNGFVSAGDDATFGITVTNNGPGTAYNVDIDDTLPAGLSWTDDKAECSITGGVLHCDIASLGDDASFTVNVTATTSPAACAVMPNTATADADNHGQVSDPGQITCQLPNIEVEKTADQGPFSAGDQIGFSVTIRNLGPGTAYDVEASDTLPGSGWSIDGPANGWTLGGDVLSFGGDGADEADLTNGASATVHVVRDSVFADCNLVENTVLGWAGNDPTATVDDPLAASAELTVDCPILGITKSPEHGEPVVAGNPIGFWVEIANTGDGDAYNVAVEDELPAGFDWTIVASQSDDGWAIEDGMLVWTDEGPGTLPAHSTSTVLVRADTDPQDCEDVTNTAVLAQGIVIIGIPFPPNTVIGEDSATEQLRCPGIGIDKDVEEGGADAEVGEEVEFTIDLSVTEGPVTDVVLTDVLPEGQTYVDDSQTSVPAADQFDPPVVNPDGTTTLVWRWDSLDDGDPAATVTYRVTIDAGFGGEALENAAEVCVAEIETCEEDLAVVNVGSRYDVSLEKSNDAPAGELDQPTVENGDSITYTLDYTVFIDGLETDVILVDLLPEGVTYVDGSATTDALFTSVTFYPDMADPVTDTNDVSGALVWTGTPASDADVSGSLTYQVTADEDDEATDDVDEGGAAQAQPLVNEAEICLADVGEDGEIDGEPFACDDAASEVFVNEPPLALTPPPTDTIADRAPASGGTNLPMIMVLFGGVMLLASVLIPAPAAARQRRDR